MYKTLYCIEFLIDGKYIIHAHNIHTCNIHNNALSLGLLIYYENYTLRNHKY